MREVLNRGRGQGQVRAGGEKLWGGDDLCLCRDLSDRPRCCFATVTILFLSVNSGTFCEQLWSPRGYPLVHQCPLL